jgi:lysophospholipid acyltransferase (LPLAT)-like uncharacterized protein
MLKKLGRKPIVLNALGGVFAAYVRLVQKTTRWTFEPRDLAEALGADAPVILSLWHGQHVFVPIGWPRDLPVSALVARHADGEINAIALEKLGFGTIRGAGGGGNQRKLIKRGGMQALRGMVRALKGGTSVAITADVPQIGGIVGEGIVLLAKLSGRPILPLAVVTRRRRHFNSWDKATLSLPFSRGAIVLGETVRVGSDADEEELEKARLAVGEALNRAHARAYAITGGDVWVDRHG